MPKTLVVTNPFAGKERGQRISDSAEIEAVLSGENAHDVVTVNTPDQKPAKSDKE